jgi:hypothetical protein
MRIGSLIIGGSSVVAGGPEWLPSFGPPLARAKEVRYCGAAVPDGSPELQEGERLNACTAPAGEGLGLHGEQLGNVFCGKQLEGFG